jgi:signal transduction histidine kinase
LITDFLLFAQPPKTNKKPWEIRNVLEETIELFTNSQDYHEGIHIHRVFPRDQIQILIDPDQIKQVFWNLLINAAQSMTNGGKISIRLEKAHDGLLTTNPQRPTQKRSKQWVKISITDSGNGIPPEDKEKIFEPFYTTKERGTGLGLSIVHKIIENHNGVIKVESEEGKGSTFTLLLPTH